MNIKNLIALFSLAIIIIMYLFTTIYNSDQIKMLFPLLILFWIGGCFFIKLYNIERELPIFDIGGILVLVTLLYSIYPFLGFWLGDFKWGILSDNRLKSLNPGPVELGSFAWNHVAYASSLAFSYIFFRKKDSPLRLQIKNVDVQKREMLFIIILLVLLELWELSFNYFGYYPHFVLQLNNMFAGTKFVVGIFIMCIGFSRWNQFLWRNTMWAFISYELLKLALGLQGRSWIFMHLIAFAMLYHIYVKRFLIKRSIIVFISALFIFVFAGFRKVGVLANAAAVASEYSLWTATNEFMSMLGTPYDIYHRINIAETLTEIPISLFFNDILFQIPSQLLPFYKWDLSQWYLDLIGLRFTGVGFMFSVIAQGVIGGGIIELLFRGAFLGTAFAMFHRYFIKNSNNIWIFVLYIFIAIKSYYTFRASTGFLLYFIIYQFGSAYIITKIGSNLIWPNKKNVAFN